MTNLREQIRNLKKLGYTDAEVLLFLGKNNDLSKLDSKQLLALGLSPKEVMQVKTHTPIDYSSIAKEAATLIPIPKDGIDGKNGIDGQKGDKGEKGERGEKGLPGKDGRDGVDGKNGRDGKDGKPGKDGKDAQVDLRAIATDAITLLESYTGDDRLNASAIKNIEENLDVRKLDLDKIILDAKQIRNLPKISSSRGGSKITQIRQLTDVNDTGLTNGDLLQWNGTKFVPMSPQSIEDVNWGEIGGTLSDQTDLQNALDAKQDILAEGAFVDGDKTKLDGIEAGADVTDETNVTDALDGATLTAVTVAGTDKVLIQDTSDSDNLKTVTAQSIADLASISGSDNQILYFDGDNNPAGDPNFVWTGSALGINNGSPGGMFEAFGSLGNIQFEATGDNIRFTKNGPNFIKTAATFGEIRFQTGVAQTALRADSNQNVGIGGNTVHHRLTINNGSISIQEQSAAGSDDAGFGQIWVKNDTPNTLWFTDDTGVDYQLNKVTSLVNVTANITLDETNDIVNVTANSITVTLPTAVGIQGKQYIIKNSGTGIVTINTTSSQTIDGQASGTITLAQYEGITVVSDGANWIIIEA